MNFKLSYLFIVLSFLFLISSKSIFDTSNNLFEKIDSSKSKESILRPEPLKLITSFEDELKKHEIKELKIEKKIYPKKVRIQKESKFININNDLLENEKINPKKEQTTLIDKKVIIFDLGNVLLKANKSKALKSLGIFRTMFSLIDGGSIITAKSDLYKLLDKHTGISSSIETFDPYNDKLPELYCDYLKGEKNSTECLKIVEKAIKEFDTSKSYKILLKKFAMFLFDPKINAEIQCTDKKALELVKKCKEKDCELFILSNYDIETYEVLREKNKELFSYFNQDSIIISGNIKLIKPDPLIYSYLKNAIEKQGINACEKNCTLIDDRIENILEARKSGIFAIECLSIDDVEIKLKELNII